MNGIFYGVGVGPGDPELLTLKAIRIINEADVIALPGSKGKETVAYKIASEVIETLDTKEILNLDMPMTNDKEALDTAHKNAAKLVEEKLSQDKSVAFLTIGDPTIYSTFGYVERLVSADGYKTAYISGITSFTAAAAAACMPLTLDNESLTIIPGIKTGNETKVIMKSGKQLNKVIQELKETDADMTLVSSCTMPDEMIYRGFYEIPEDAPYLSLLIVK